MLNAPALFSVASVAAPQADAVRATIVPAFSYDQAVAALERQSARSLDIHGGKPNTPVTGGRTAPAAAAGAPAENAAARQTDATDFRSQTAGQNPAAQPLGADSTGARSPATLPAPVAATTPLATIPAAPAPSQPSTLGAVSARDSAGRVKAEAPRAPALLRAPASAVKQFAEILAQRLDGASQFDLRLDPPALGSVEGRLTLSDDGQATLALSFDNQSAFDLFRRDDAALRFALADAGFDLAGRNLQFSFREPAQGDGRRAAAETSRPSVSTAPLHRGAVDIRA